MTLVVDASVAFKWYVEEPRSNEARAILASNEPLLAPDIIVAEVANAAWLRLSKAEISAAQAEGLLTRLLAVFPALVPAADLIVRAVQIATELDHPVYDALYVATAERWNAPLVTADKRLLAKCTASPWSALVRPLGTL